jgi:hypothetical protein
VFPCLADGLIHELLKPRDLILEGIGFAQRKKLGEKCSLSHSLDSECVADLQEVLKMSVSILRGLAAEWALLHHVDESWFKFETVISDVRLWTSPDVGTGRS